MGWTHYLLFSKNSLKLFQWFSSTPWLMLIAMHHFVRITREKFDVQIYNFTWKCLNLQWFVLCEQQSYILLYFTNHTSSPWLLLPPFCILVSLCWVSTFEQRPFNHTKTSSQHWRVTHKLSWHVIWNLTHKAPWDYIYQHSVTKSPTVCTKNVIAHQYSYFKLPYVCCNVIFLVMSAPSAASV